MCQVKQLGKTKVRSVVLLLELYHIENIWFAPADIWLRKLDLASKLKVSSNSGKRPRRDNLVGIRYNTEYCSWLYYRLACFIPKLGYNRHWGAWALNHLTFCARQRTTDSPVYQSDTGASPGTRHENSNQATTSCHCDEQIFKKASNFAVLAPVLFSMSVRHWSCPARDTAVPNNNSAENELSLLRTYGKENI